MYLRITKDYVREHNFVEMPDVAKEGVKWCLEIY